jgi:hypothetical protein
MLPGQTREEARMGSGQGSAIRWRLALLALLLTACASSGGGGATRDRLPVTELASVVGRWEGLISGLSSRPSVDQDFVEVVIKADATYEARAVRTVGVLRGRGTVQVRDGSLALRSESGATGTAQLFSVGGRLQLEIDATSSDGRRVSARLSPKS